MVFRGNGGVSVYVKSSTEYMGGGGSSKFYRDLTPPSSGDKW